LPPDFASVPISAGDRTRVHSLDSSRGIAAIYVVFFHVIALRPKIKIPMAALDDAFAFGYSGVFLFFVISGFSLSMTMPRHDRLAAPWISYGLSRFFRIAPAFFVMLAVSMMLHYFWSWETASLGRILMNITFLFNLVPGHQQGIVAASWTIGVEMIFYVLFIPLYRTKAWVKVLIMVSTFCVFLMIKGVISPDYAQWTVLGYFPLFVTGMLAFDSYDRLVNTKNSNFVGIALIFVGTIALAILASITHGVHILDLRAAIGIGYALLLTGCALSRPIILEAKFLSFFGTISYSLYLVHAPVIFSCVGMFTRIAASLPPIPAYAACVAMALAIATPIAYALFIFVEKPGIKNGIVAVQFFEDNYARLQSAFRGIIPKASSK
jgi:peptidoglycan/LPS O-acetylase OafA/YrhL